MTTDKDRAEFERELDKIWPAVDHSGMATDPTQSTRPLFCGLDMLRLWQAARSRSGAPAQCCIPVGFIRTVLMGGDPGNAPEYDTEFVAGDELPDVRACWRPVYTEPQPLPKEFDGAFVTSISNGSEKRYEVVFKFRDIHAMQDAHNAWVLRKDGAPAPSSADEIRTLINQARSFLAAFTSFDPATDSIERRNLAVLITTGDRNGN